MNTSMKHTEQYRVLDLFSGCGGLALGFQNAGFIIDGGIEIDQAAATTASYNLFWRNGIDHEHFCEDITKSPVDILKFDRKTRPVVIGGPPCQAYSIAGRAKLNSLGENRSFHLDSRGQLYQDFLRFALELDAQAVVMENVPDSVNYNGENIPHKVCEILEKNGYDSVWTILNSADYGVPQIRERVIVMAVKKDRGGLVQMPVPTHNRHSDYRTQNEARLPSFMSSRFFREPNKPADDAPKWVTVGDAFSDLPSVFSDPDQPYVPIKLNVRLPYKLEPQNKFQKQMRSMSDKVSGHAFRKTLRDFRIFNDMTPGDNYLNALEIANVHFKKALKERRVNQKDHPEEYKKIKKEFVPPYSADKFISKWRKLDPWKPSHTVVAHLGTDTYSHIHPWEPRGITVREAARLQSFPDDFVFNCTMSDAFKQIGNAVPPLMSKAIAKAMRENLSIAQEVVR
ncbi:DNA cytosine methyltransferase [Lederbergia wuyishanensis]|uniref:DNA (cytosine-5-)-methyltransferase n=1 Tax=Lederbergia wuyishanensis TaxID=1347903 RepID=A0ABU0D2D1_9BACI|nr:DNA cytosine methyltransferase [Lederbergia wuyishanensis]MCJ8007273.1 DNA cytosine methyltransferase [Lederbergia wuyishanensis]MDQ0342572.1 DNA (cytosine-5)-methyltransferase 1 [Lederbergia wuyishanensis]